MIDLCRVLCLFAVCFTATATAQRSFSIDYENNQFLRDGKPFRYISGSIHYFRTHPDQWEARLQAIRAAGLNAIETYIPWNFHETFKNEYDFTGMRNFSRFFELAAENELAVIVRPGPYVCAEWENGGLPYWLLKYPNIKQRSSDSNFLRESLAWWDVLLPMIRPYLWQNNGPVIMVQIENEYGSFGCDHVYLHALRDKAVEILGNDTVLFTTIHQTIECGVIDGVYATVDFGERGLLLADEYFKIQADANKKKGGPRVDSELYPGWYRTWGEKGIEQNPSASTVLEITEKLYNLNASFNYYMFHGGTNFGFWNGAEYAAGVRQLVVAIVAVHRGGIRKGEVAPPF
ncbi:beta-galactosidase domain protein, partial [Cooperia oncophora]